MHHSLPSVPELHGVDDTQFRDEIAHRTSPVVLKGFVQHWPAVQKARHSREQICTYLVHHDNGTPVDAIMTAPEHKGRIFYQDDMRGFNYLRNSLPIASVIQQLMRYAQFPDAPALAVQSALITHCLPKFSSENPLSALDETVLPRIWIGSRITTPTHFDQSNNLACVVAGLRRFTLFPPEQVSNLYIGPLDFAPTPSPISMVALDQAEDHRYPKFKQALAAASQAELEPGDALFIPTLWWHHVESLAPFNVLVNYWWSAMPERGVQPKIPFDSLLHSLLTMRALPAQQKAAWNALFQHYLFNPDTDPAAHLPAHCRGILGDMTEQQELALRERLIRNLKPE